MLLRDYAVKRWLSGVFFSHTVYV